MKKLLSIILFLLILSPLISSFMPLTHKFLNQELLNTYKGDSEFYNICSKNQDACYVGNILADISVVYYFTEGGKNYVVTHSPSFCRNMLANAVGEVEEACAIGSCLHATQDFQSHNFMVTNAIKKTGLVNQVIHVFAEQHLDNIVVNENPNLGGEVLGLTSESWNKCTPLVKKVLTGFSEYDDEIASGKIDNIINTFISEVEGTIAKGNSGYDIAFQTKTGVFGKLEVVPLTILFIYFGVMFLFLLLAFLLVIKDNKNLLNWISLIFFGIIFLGLLTFFLFSAFGSSFGTFITLVKPVSNLVPIGNADTHITQSIKNGQDFFNQGEEWVIAREDPDASGFSTLKKANASVKILDYLILVMVVLFIIILVYFNYRKPKNTFSF